MNKAFNIVDMFCGAGGESTGIMKAAQELDLNVRLTAINHWERAIETHAANHPSAEHLCESVEHIDPARAMRGEKIKLLWASPECTHHSVARGGRPRSDQSRTSAWMILKWLSELYVERVIIENVPEFMTWGPLDDAGKPMQSQKGKTFRAFVSSLRSLGYSVDWRVLTAADYGDPTTRKRLFIQAVKGRRKILWPEITHIDGGANLAGYQSWRTARDIIDWSIPGTSIFDRKRPLADATMRRIASGIEKYWGGCAKPFLAVLYGSNDVRSLDLPFPTVTTSGAHHALVEPFVVTVSHSGGENRHQELARPLPTICAGGVTHGIVEPFILPNEGYYRGNKAHSLDQPIGAVTAARGYGGLIEPFIIDNHTSGAQNTTLEPLRTITTKGWFGLVTGDAGIRLDIRFRMLKPHELKIAQGFPAEYRILGTNAEQTKQIGNAVPVNTAKALAMAALAM